MTGTFAPVFEHGKGIFRDGDWSFPLHETEGMEVIRKELAAVGVNLTGQGEVALDRQFLYRSKYFDRWTLDGVDLERGIGVEFLTTEDCVRFGAYVHRGGMRIDYDLREGAKALLRLLGRKGDCPYTVAVLYDPVVPPPPWNPEKDGPDQMIEVPVEEEKREALEAAMDEEFERKRAKAVARSQALLRRQAQDFIAWLRRRKVI